MLLLTAESCYRGLPVAVDFLCANPKCLQRIFDQTFSKCLPVFLKFRHLRYFFSGIYIFYNCHTGTFFQRNIQFSADFTSGFVNDHCFFSDQISHCTATSISPTRFRLYILLHSIHRSLPWGVLRWKMQLRRVSHRHAGHPVS